MACGELIFRGVLLVFIISLASLRCMNLKYSYIQAVLDNKDKKFIPELSDKGIFPQFPSGLRILKGVKFHIKAQFSSAFEDGNGLFSRSRHVLYTFDIAENVVIRLLISIHVFPNTDGGVASYVLNIDKYDMAYDRILNAIFIPPEAINNLDVAIGKLVLPIEVIRCKLDEVFNERIVIN